MKYLSWDEKTISDFSETNVTELYNKGYVFTRLGKSTMQQTRSVRIDLSKFSPNSENRRILKKVADLTVVPQPLPLKDYDWSIGKLAKDFYETKFGPGIMSAQKVKEALTDPSKSNFNILLSYTVNSPTEKSGAVGFSICYTNSVLLHYSYPFYNLSAPKDTGLGMMLLAIQHAKEKNLKYIYLGSLQRPGDTYKLQFEGLEWFDGKEWRSDLLQAKELLKAQ